jgi:Tfp pilus tip-associated adhesin PilY1
MSTLKSWLKKPQLRVFVYSLVFCLAGGLSQPTYAVFDPVNDDTDIFLANPNVPADRPNVFLYVDNTANWNLPFTNEKSALVTVVNSLSDQFNLGLMLFVETGSPNDNQDGTYARFAMRQMTSANKTVLASLVNNFDKLADKGNNSSTGMGMVEIYRYLTGQAEIASNHKVKTDYQNNTEYKACSSCSTTSHPATAAGLTGYALNANTGGALYNSPLAGSCQHNFIIYLSNGPLTEPTPSVNQSRDELSTAGYNISTILPVTPNFYQGNWMDEWAKFLASTDLNGVAAGAPHATTYTVEVDPGTSGHGPDMTALMKSTAKNGNGKYFAVSSGNGGQDIVTTLLKIFTEIQAVNSVFASTTLPVSVNVRGTNLNQLYIGVFRPDAQKAPRWFGNLKMYQLGADPSTGNVFIADSTNKLATNSTTGFIDSSAISFWTQSSSFWSFLDPSSISYGTGGTSDRPDGDVVEKGGAAQMLRTTYASSQSARNLYTCTGSCGNGNSLSTTPFNTSNTAISAASLNFNAFSVVSLTAFVSKTISALTDSKSVTSLNTNTSAGSHTVTLNNGAGAGVSVTSLTNAAPQTITAISNSPSVVTITNIARQSTKTKATITAVNSYTIGQTVYIYGVVGATEYNGTWTVSSPTSTNFVITNTVNFATANPTNADIANAKVATTGVVITATVPSHGFTDGQSVAIAATITPATGANIVINSSFTITYVNANTFTFTVASATAPYNTASAIGSIVSATATAATLTATATTSAAHGFSNGAHISITGATPSGYNSTDVVITTAGPGTTTFTYPLTTAGLTSPASGTITAWPLGSTTVTVTDTAHGFSSSDGNTGTTNDQITIAGGSPSGYNGSFEITVIDLNTYRYTTSTALPINTGSPVTATPTSGVSTSNTARATVTNHQFGAPGATPTVLIAGAADSAYNGTFTATIVDANTFTYTVPGTPAPDTSTSITATLISGGHPVAFATVPAHGYGSAGSTFTITIKGATPASYNLADVTGTVVDADTFTYVLSTVATAQGAATGTLTANQKSTTATAKVISHGLITGDTVTISGASSCTSPSEFNVINKAVTVVDVNTFTYTLTPLPDCDATGTITESPSGGTTQTAVNNLINWVRGMDNQEDENVNSSLTDVRASIHGDVLHSRPAVVNYNRHGNDDDVYIFYGANDGVFRAVKGGMAQSKNTEPLPGHEAWGFIPSEHFGQLKRLRDNTPTISSTNKKPYFADGTIGSYVLDHNNDGKLDVTIDNQDKVYLYISMHRGGRFIYALDVSDPSDPKLLWKHTSSDTGWGELGETWSVPQVQTIPWSNANSAHPVLIFGAGYDADVEDVDTATITAINATTGAVTAGGVHNRSMGRGIFVVDAFTGAILWQAGPANGGGGPVSVPAPSYHYETVSGMIYAIPSDMAVVTARGSALKNRAYVGDTGGNIWRVDMDDPLVSAWTVNKLASVRDTSGLSANPVSRSGLRKFLFPPDVVFNTDAVTPYDAVIIGSGDREHPFETVVTNRMYMFKDYGVGTTPDNSNILESDLFDATSDCAQDVAACTGSTDAEKLAAQNDALADLSSKPGWYITLLPGEKAVGSAVTLNSVVFFNTNQPSSVADVASTSCLSDLGVARQYQVNYTNAFAVSLAPLNPSQNQDNPADLTAADRGTIYPGGGYLPSPVPVTVEIGGKIYQVVLSGVSVVIPPATPLGARLRKFWYKEFE